MKKFALIVTIVLAWSACAKLPVEEKDLEQTTQIIIDSTYIDKCDSLEQELIRVNDSINVIYDTLNVYRLKNDSLVSDLFILTYKLERIRYYNKIAANNKNLFFLRGWINRVLNE